MENLRAGAAGSSGFTQGAWKEALHEYIRTAYKNGGPMCDIESGGVTYKVMKKDDKITFYDASGNTLFNVTYEQLETEYAQMMERKAEDAAVRDTAKNTLSQKSSDTKEAGGPAKGRAEKKLEKELEKARDKSFAELVIKHLIKRCGEDEGLAQDVAQEHKTWEKCYGYIFSKAQKSAQKGAAGCAVRDDVVCGWAEDYYHMDDRALEERRQKKAEKARKKPERGAKEKAGKKAAGTKENSKAAVQERAEAVPARAEKDNARLKKNTRDIEGQLDMFSMMGM